MSCKTILNIIFSSLLISCVNKGSTSNVELYVSDNSSMNSQIIHYQGYNVSYNYEMLIPNWVSYELLADETNGDFSRKGKSFKPDPSLFIRQADNNDYRNSGWSRGHMAPAGDFKWSDEAMSETFYFTNCCPQDQSLNAGQWSTLEKKTRDSDNKYGKVIVITGPIVGDNRYGKIGANYVVVPNAFFKVLRTDEQAIAFIMYNTSNNENLQRCAMTVDNLENVTRFDFFPELDDDTENYLESSFKLKYWGL